MRIWGVNIGVVDRILVNFNRTGGLFHSILYTKLFSLLLLGLSCLGTKGVKAEKMSWGKIWTVLAVGFCLFFLNWWILLLPMSPLGNTALYIFTMTSGYICLLMGGLWMSRLLKHNLMEDVFNNENESFMQETRLMENEYSVNLPTRFYYKKKWQKGWINVVNPFRASIVLGTPGSGKSFAVVNNYIKQQIEKGYSMYIYDFKFPDLSMIAYNHLMNHMDGDKEAKVVINTVGNIFSGQVVGETAKTLSERFGKVLQKRQSISINRQDVSTSINTQMDSLIPPSKISGLTQGMFVGSVSDNFNERIEQKIFHAEIVVDTEKVKREESRYQKLPIINDFLDADGNDCMKQTIQDNYNQIKEDLKKIVKDELERIANDENLKHLIQK